MKSDRTAHARFLHNAYAGARIIHRWIPLSQMLGVFVVSFASVALSLLAAPASAQQYPNKPIRMLVGYPPGGPADISARLVAPYLSEALGQQVVVDNRPGAGGTIAATLLSRAAPDGYTISVAGSEMVISPNLRKLLYDPLKDFAPVSRIGANALALVVHPGIPAKSVAELIALAKAKPGTINFASSGIGSTAHLAGELLKSLAGIDIVHVSYKGAVAAMTELIGGHVQMLLTGYPGAAPHIQTGKLRVLAVTSTKPITAAPDVPTIDATVQGYEANTSYGVLLPARAPKAIIARLHQEISAFVKKPETREKLIAIGFEPDGNTPGEYAAQIKSELAKWAKVIKIAKVPVE
jgi:tripartite-type tricarboxylate transporter receptor subunit TctC